MLASWLQTIVASLVIASTLYYFFACYFKVNNATMDSSLVGTGNVLLVIAHPDDECMFFGPTLLSLLKTAKSNKKIHVLCLSTGNADGLGKVRSKELVKSCAVLGIPEMNVHIIEHEQLQDSIATYWDPTVVQEVIQQHVKTLNITQLLTFDKGGISGHPNHISCHNGSILVSKSLSLPLYTLRTVSIWRKYILFLDILFTARTSNSTHTKRVMFVNSPKDMLRTRRAMYQHQSQLLWFRKLYVWFSRYMFINDLDVYRPSDKQVSSNAGKTAKSAKETRQE